MTREFSHFQRLLYNANQTDYSIASNRANLLATTVTVPLRSPIEQMEISFFFAFFRFG